jgi:hypothetical protein
MALFLIALMLPMAVSAQNNSTWVVAMTVAQPPQGSTVGSITFGYTPTVYTGTGCPGAMTTTPPTTTTPLYVCLGDQIGFTVTGGNGPYTVAVFTDNPVFDTTHPCPGNNSSMANGTATVLAGTIYGFGPCIFISNSSTIPLPTQFHVAVMDHSNVLYVADPRLIVGTTGNPYLVFTQAATEICSNIKPPNLRQCKKRLDGILRTANIIPLGNGYD